MPQRLLLVSIVTFLFSWFIANLVFKGIKIPDSKTSLLIIVAGFCLSLI